jgi:hypothetical protein
MRALRAAFAASRSTVDLSEIITWTKVVVTVVATTALVLAASFVAVSMSLA